jgi:hypothetical protein
MNPRTRDNLIYLTVGLSIAALVAADAFYADSHGRKMWVPSRFAFRSVCSTALIWYVVIRVIRQAKQTLPRVLAGVLFATMLHLTIVFASRQIIEQLPGLAFAALFALEGYFVLYATEKCALWGTTRGAGTCKKMQIRDFDVDRRR